ncbi:MAG: hypothetical protein A2Y38_24875 [Spirochaetes bacterium GWB1_59_5]|nr:MAG: hypothetical protein A2Y38_24875 [Spirochaetes bacterium GWB1_59_5]
MACTTFAFLPRTIGVMSITPLYTAAEIDAEITQAKLDLASARKALSSGLNSNGTDRRVQRDTVKNLQDHLNWLQGQRAALEIGHGPQAVIGRPAR